MVSASGLELLPTCLTKSSLWTQRSRFPMGWGLGSKKAPGHLPQPSQTPRSPGSPKAHFVDWTHQWSQKKFAFLSMKPVVSRTKGMRGPLIACRCLNGTQLAGLCLLLDLVSIPVALGRRGSSSWDQGQHAESSPRAVFLIGEHLSFWLCAADIQAHVLWFPRTLSVDLCWRQSAALCSVLCLPGYSPPALQVPFTSGSPGVPRTSGDPNRVWARTTAGCPVAGS